MANEVVKYQNDLNTATMRTWSEIEMNILFSIVSKIRDTSLNTTTFTFEELKSISQFKKNFTKKEFVNELISVSRKLSSLNYLERSEDGWKANLFILFQTFTIDGKEETLDVMVHPQFEYVFNKIGMEFTRFELAEFIDVSSTYAKMTYRILKQYRTTGWWKVTLDDFRALLDVPTSYKSCDIDKNILKPILDQLGGNDEQAIFRNLKVTKNKKKGRGRGGVLTGYTFTFQAEKTDDWVEGKFKKQQPQTRTETLPEWVGKELTETPMAEEEQAKLRQQLAEMRSKNPNINEKHP